jgi:hypothetical protein
MANKKSLKGGSMVHMEGIFYGQNKSCECRPAEVKGFSELKYKGKDVLVLN